MHDNSATIVTLDIAPHTKVLSAVFVRQHTDVDVAVFSPNGTRATPEMENVDIRMTPSAVIVRIYSPVPGNWSLQGVGPASKLVASVDIDNPLVLKMIEQPPLPVGEPAIIEAAAFVGESPQLLSGAVIEATIRKASGTTTVVALNDRGEDGDRTPNDGIYSVQLSAPKSQGINSVSLKLSWTDYAAVMRSSTAFRSESFPTLDLVGVTNVDTTAGNFATVARVQVRVGGYPYLLSASEIKAVLSGPAGKIAGVVVPVDEPEPGKAWEFDISVVIPESGAYEVEVVLDSTFAGRAYSRTAPLVTTHAVILEEPLELLGMPVWVVPTIGALMVLLAGFAVWVLRKTSPFGFIVDDQDRVVVDFAQLERSWYRKLISRDAIKASEAPDLPFDGGTFKFSGDRVKLVHNRALGDPSMRVDSRPAGAETEMGADVWLGIGGRLLTFQREHGSAVPSSSEPADSAIEEPGPPATAQATTGS